MDWRAFVRVSVGSLALRNPSTLKAIITGSTFTCLCEIRLANFPPQIVPIPSYISGDPDPQSVAANFYLDEDGLKKLLHHRWYDLSSPYLELLVFTGRQGCGIGGSKHLGTFKIRVSPEWGEGRSIQIYRGWTCIGTATTEGGKPVAELHAVVKVEPDPRLVFEFDAEPALSPQVFQTQGNARQPIFSCKFSRDKGTRYGLDDGVNSWAVTLNGEKEKDRKERKGWVVTIHDLSGSPVAAASIVTPFVPSSGADHVSRSNPGAWLILRSEPGMANMWSPWGRLEAWREGGSKGLGCRFQLVPECAGVNGISDNIVISETVISMYKGGEFLIDTAKIRLASASPVDSSQSSGEFTFNMALSNINGFVMNCSIQGKSRNKKKLFKPIVQIAVRHMPCLEDAAVFIALAAAVDLSMDACQPFSKQLRKELSGSMSPL